MAEYICATCAAPYPLHRNDCPSRDVTTQELLKRIERLELDVYELRNELREHKAA